MEHFYQKIKNYTHPSCISLYKQVVEKLSSGASILEIGSYHGSSLAFLVVEAINQGKDINIHSIDPLYEVQPEGNLALKDEDAQGQKEIFYKNMEPIKDHFIMHEGFSQDVVGQFEDEYFDFIFVDGDHSAEGVYQDCKNYFPKLKVGGVFAGDDWGAANGETAKGIQGFFTQPMKGWVWALCKTSKNTWAFGKNQPEYEVDFDWKQ